ncbi:uncharacterized protein LOC134568408 isoform X1 [Pelobates fuscus]|uniref:uncharacterized protein LOC134568408 isoform X1 n=2 Tax=Pelobates fuscus TaxID=191477 RepID=UPI002FE4AC48
MPMTRESSKYSNGKNPFDYDDIAIYFTKEEWDCLKEEDRKLYKEVMMENYQTLQILGYANMKPVVISHIEQGEEPCIKDYPTPDENLFGLNSGIADSSKASKRGTAQSGRAVRFTFEENTALVTKVIKYYNSITGVSASKISSSKKKAIWKIIVDAVNAVGGHGRSMKVCKKRYHDIKRHLKRKLSRASKQTRVIGGEEHDADLNPYEEELRQVLGSEIILCVNGDVDTDRLHALKQRRRCAYQRALASWPTETSEDSSDSLSLQRSNSLQQLDTSLSSDGSDLSQDLLVEFEYNKVHVADKPAEFTQSSLQQEVPLCHNYVTVWAPENSEEALDSFNLESSDRFQQLDLPSTSEGSDLSLDLLTDFDADRLPADGKPASWSGNSIKQEDQEEMIMHFVDTSCSQSAFSTVPQLPNIHVLGDERVPAAVLLDKSVEQIQQIVEQISSHRDLPSVRHNDYIRALNDLRREIQVFNNDREILETRLFRSQLLQLKRERLALQRERLEYLKRNPCQQIETSSEEE